MINVILRNVAYQVFVKNIKFKLYKLRGQYFPPSGINFLFLDITAFETIFGVKYVI